MNKMKKDKTDTLVKVSVKLLHFRHLTFLNRFFDLEFMDICFVPHNLVLWVIQKIGKSVFLNIIHKRTERHGCRSHAGWDVRDSQATFDSCSRKLFKISESPSSLFNIHHLWFLGPKTSDTETEVFILTLLISTNAQIMMSTKSCHLANKNHETSDGKTFHTKTWK